MLVLQWNLCQHGHASTASLSFPSNPFPIHAINGASVSSSIATSKKIFARWLITSLIWFFLHHFKSSLAQTTTASIQPVTQQYTFTHPHKKFFETSEFPCMLCGAVLKNQNDLIDHMIRHTATSRPSSSPTTIVERERLIDVSSTPTDLSNTTTQYK